MDVRWVDGWVVGGWVDGCEVGGVLGVGVGEEQVGGDGCGGGEGDLVEGCEQCEGEFGEVGVIDCIVCYIGDCEFGECDQWLCLVLVYCYCQFVCCFGLDCECGMGWCGCCVYDLGVDVVVEVVCCDV